MPSVPWGAWAVPSGSGSPAIVSSRCSTPCTARPHPTTTGNDNRRRTAGRTTANCAPATSSTNRHGTASSATALCPRAARTLPARANTPALAQTERRLGPDRPGRPSGDLTRPPWMIVSPSAAADLRQHQPAASQPADVGGVSHIRAATGNTRTSPAAFTCPCGGCPRLAPTALCGGHVTVIGAWPSAFPRSRPSSHARRRHARRRQSRSSTPSGRGPDRAEAVRQMLTFIAAPVWP